jgi:hypothetical protein
LGNFVPAEEGAFLAEEEQALSRHKKDEGSSGNP